MQNSTSKTNKFKLNAKKIIKSILPETAIVWLIYFFTKNKFELKKNKALKNTATNKVAWVLATGPSIKSQDLRLLKDQDCYSVSNFFLHEHIDTIKPKIHFFAPYHQPMIRENYIDWIKLSANMLPKETEIFLALRDKEMIEESGALKDRKVHYAAFGTNNYKNIDFTKIAPNFQTGPQLVLCYLIYCGYDTIYLLGCDHNTLRTYGENVENFYSTNKEMRINATNEKGWLPVIEHLQTQVKVFQIYERIQEENKHVNIINCSHTSWLRFTNMKSDNYEHIISALKESCAELS